MNDIVYNNNYFLACDESLCLKAIFSYFGYRQSYHPMKRLLPILLLFSISNNVFSQEQNCSDITIKINKQGKHLIYDAKGRRSVDKREWDVVSDCHNGYRIGYLNGKSAIINTKGTVVNEELYDSARFFYNGLASVKQNGKWGYINEAGVVIVDFVYDHTDDFIETLAEVQQGNKLLLIDIAGKIINSVDAIPVHNTTTNTVLPRHRSTNTISTSQTAMGIVCPDNLDFENGSFYKWETNIGSTSTNSGGNVITLPAGGWLNGLNTIKRQMIQDRNANSNATDYYGGFSIHPPTGGQYSVKLGSDQDDVPFSNSPNKRAEAVRYAINVPQNATDYSITFSYAVVFENPFSPVHSDDEQPRFRSRLYTQGGQTIDCATFTFVASGPLPGFQISNISTSSSTIKYKDWSSVYVNLSDYGGQTVFLEFATADCTLGAHWGYAYVDVVECGIAGTSQYSCGAPNVATLTAPPGFQQYKWYDNNFTSLLGNAQSLYLSNPVLGSDYKVVVIPYPNTGCATCDCSDTLTLKVAATNPLADAGADKNICIATSTTIGTTSTPGVNYSWSPSNGLSNSQVASPVANPTVTTRYILTTTNTVTGCVAKDTVDVFVNPIPNASFTVNRASQCVNADNFLFTNTSTISTGTLSYSWNFGDGNTSNNMSPNHSYNSAGVYTVRLTITSATGCTDFHEEQVVVNNFPSAAFPVNNSSQCLSGNQFTFTSPSVAGVTYTWNISGVPFGNQTSHQYSFGAAGSYPVKLVAVNGAGCTDSSTQTVIVHPQPVADFSANDIDQCLNGNAFTLVNTSTISQGSINYGWNFGDGTGTSALINPTYNYTNSGNFIIRLIATSNFGCIDSTKKNVTVEPNPLMSFNINDGAQCFENNHFIFTNGSTISQGIMSYSWDFGNGGISNQISPTYNYATPGTYNIKLVGTTNKGCKDSTTQAVYVHPEPVINFTVNDATQCLSGNNFTFNNTTSIQSGSLIYRWSFGDGSSMNSSQHPNHSFTTAGAYTIKLVGMSNYGCVDSLSKQVNVYHQPVVYYTVNDGSQCLPRNSFSFTNISTVPTGTNNYSWSFGDGITSSLLNPVHSYVAAGNYQVRLIATTNNGCIDSLVAPINVFAIPDVTISSGNLSFCDGETRILTSSATAGSGVIQNYEWYRNGIQIPATGNTLAVSSSGSYVVKVINSNGCEKESAASLITVNPLPTGDIANPTSYNICEGYNISLQATPGYSYQWFFNGNPITSAITDNILATQAGTYTVQMTNQFGCSIMGANNVVLNFVARPDADFIFDRSCLNIPISFSNTSNVSATGAVSWSWSFGDGGLASVFNPQHTYNATGVYDVKLVVRSQLCNQLTDSAEKEIKIVAPPTGIRYASVNAVMNEPQQLAARAIGTDYLWKPAMGLNNQTLANPVFRHNDDQEYQIRIRLASGCIVTDTVLVMLHGTGDIFVPRAWSPNLDGHNDYLYPILVGMMELKMFRIFNRWGQLMFETREPKKGWNGIFNNTSQPNDTYTWTVEALYPDGKTVRRSGNAVLIR